MNKTMIYTIFSYGNTPCVIGESEKGFKLIFTTTDLDNFNGNVELFLNL